MLGSTRVISGQFGVISLSCSEGFLEKSFLVWSIKGAEDSEDFWNYIRGMYFPPSKINLIFCLYQSGLYRHFVIRPLFVKLSVIQSFYPCQVNLSPSIGRLYAGLYGAGN